MSQDPNQPPSGYGNDPQNPYGTPPPQEFYGSPQQEPYGAPPQQGPYGVPPPPGPYGVPPQQGPYGAPPQGFYGPPPGYSYNMPQSSPLPLGEAIGQLPNQYIKVLTKPSALTFAQEMGKASWDIIWVQLIIYAIIAAILGYAANALQPNRFNSAGTSTLSPNVGQLILLGSSIGSIVFVPLFFFAGVGIIYLIAKAFGGTGTFRTQSYTTLLITVPFGLVSGILGLVPILGSFVGFAFFVYQIVLNIFSVMAVHRLS